MTESENSDWLSWIGKLALVVLIAAIVWGAWQVSHAHWSEKVNQIKASVNQATHNLATSEHP